MACQAKLLRACGWKPRDRKINPLRATFVNYGSRCIRRCATSRRAMLGYAGCETQVKKLAWPWRREGQERGSVRFKTVSGEQAQLDWVTLELGWQAAIQLALALSWIVSSSCSGRPLKRYSTAQSAD